jgi:Tat protein translocase TatB subunit
MFGIGYQEMFVVLVVALIIFGPSRLPELAGQVGRWVRDFRRMSADLTGEFEKTFAEVDEVKKSFKREMQSIQDEVEGVGRSARGDLKKTTARSTVAGKKATAGALKAGSGDTGSEATKTAAAAQATGNGARPKMPALASRKSAGTRGANGSAGAPGAMLATKDDPLADVSFFDLDASRVVSSNGKAAASNGLAVLETDDALSRVRRRRAAASYGRRPSA